MEELMRSELFIISLNLLVYTFFVWFIGRFRIKHINALFLSIPVVIVALQMLEIDLETYQRGSQFFNVMLGPSVVALGYLIHKNIKSIGRRILPLLLCVALGAVINSVAINLLFKLFSVDPVVVLSVHPKSVTTPIALEMSSELGAIAPLTVLSVVFAGITGSVIGVPLMNLLRIRHPFARGAALGAASHAIGTAKALELGQYEGAVSGLVIGLMGVITALLLPEISTWFF